MTAVCGYFNREGREADTKSAEPIAVKRWSRTTPRSIL